MKNFQKFPLFLLLVLMIGVIISCSKDSTEPQETPPTLPPASVFMMEFESFPLLDGDINPDAPTQLKTNWSWAATNVVVWNTVLFVAAQLQFVFN
jgi:hypothetical protein